MVSIATEALLPVVVLVAWTLIVLLWMFATRLPALTAAGVDPQQAVRTADVPALVPGRVQWVADNYNHLMEQPTVFYALTLALAVSGTWDSLLTTCAWIYVGSRVLHSIVQNVVNVVMLRFGVFLVGTAALAVMTVVGLTRMV